ncbi:MULTISPECIES: hypothetical protein [Shinella]|uniref:Uncharacterized protein n=1 Tax=Shinella lacus TaxID=2654216 RepID=A0ABT1R0S5_9HYPH|nr:hypothetical protein [Shinella lacus]
MSGKINRIYEALIEGAETGLSGDELFKHVASHCPNASSKKIVKASLLALSDPDLKDANILQVVYALAIKHRLDPVSKGDLEDTEEPSADKAQIKERKQA